MDKIRDRMVVLRAEVDDAHEIINQLKAQLKTLEQENLSKEQQIVSLSHRNHVLEEEAEENDKTLRETNEKLRQTDIKADHYERKVQALEDQNAKLEQKYENAIKEHSTVKKELDDLASQMADI